MNVKHQSSLGSLYSNAKRTVTIYTEKRDTLFASLSGSSSKGKNRNNNSKEKKKIEFFHKLSLKHSYPKRDVCT